MPNIRLDCIRGAYCINMAAMANKYEAAALPNGWDESSEQFPDRLCWNPMPKNFDDADVSTIAYRDTYYLPIEFPGYWYTGVGHKKFHYEKKIENIGTTQDHCMRALLRRAVTTACPTPTPRCATVISLY
jgi:hypothetical protein